MGPLSRFEKIEAERPPRESGPRPEPERFLATEAPQALAPPVAPVTRVDGAEPGLRTADGELDRLPTLVCDLCGVESSKFSDYCRGCGASLSSEGAVALNLERLRKLEAEAEAERLRAAERLAAPGPAEVVPEAPRAPDPETLYQTFKPWAWPLSLGLVAMVVMPRLALLAVGGVAAWAVWYVFLRPWGTRR